jgi:hypothetical protein
MRYRIAASFVWRTVLATREAAEYNKHLAMMVCSMNDSVLRRASKVSAEHVSVCISKRLSKRTIKDRSLLTPMVASSGDWRLGSRSELVDTSAVSCPLLKTKPRGGS